MSSETRHIESALKSFDLSFIELLRRSKDLDLSVPVLLLFPRVDSSVAIHVSLEVCSSSLHAAATVLVLDEVIGGIGLPGLVVHLTFWRNEKQIDVEIYFHTILIIHKESPDWEEAGGGSVWLLHGILEGRY